MPDQTVAPSPYAASLAGRDSADSRVIVADGSSVRLSMSNGQLKIEDGLTSCPRTRRVSRIGTGIERIIILAAKGYVSLEVFNWCATLGVSIMQVNRAGELLFSGGASNTGDISLLRTQIAAIDNPGVSADIVKRLLCTKIEGHAAILSDMLGQPEAANRLDLLIPDMMTATSIDECRLVECKAAAQYFSAWSGNAAIRWSTRDARRIPAHWRVYRRRQSELVEGKQNATDPVNALLNYAYMVGYAEARLACISVGLDPRLGILHYDKDGRDSLACDILETIRPEIDRRIIKMMHTRRWSILDFMETGSGVCKLVAPVTHEICEYAVQWRDSAQKTARMVAELLTGQSQPQRAKRPVRILPDYDHVYSIIPDDLWQLIRAELPHGIVNPGTADNRVIIAGILWKLRNDVAWSRIPRSFGVSDTLMRTRYRDWTQTGVWPRIARHLSQAALT